MKKISIILLSIISLAYAEQNIEIVGGTGAGNPKLAVINFTDENGSISNEISSDFKVTGEFNVLNYVSRTDVESGVQYAVSGAYKSADNGQAQIIYKLVNNITGQVLLNQTASFNNRNTRKAVHAISNNLYQKLTNTPGAFTSKIALAVENAPGRYSVLISDYDGYNAQTLISATKPITSLAWDKSGKFLSYVTYEMNKPVVYIQNIAQGSRYILANFNGSNSSPDFVPNSNRLIVTLSKDYGSHLYLLNNTPFSAQTQAMPLLKFGTIDTEADMADNGKIVFTSNHDGGPQIFMTDLSGSTPTRITNGLGNYNTTARFSNDGAKITFINRNNGTLQAYVQDLKTQSAYPISQNTNRDLAPSFAPNDKLIIFSSDDKIYISNITGTTQTKLNDLNYYKIIDQRWAKNY